MIAIWVKWPRQIDPPFFREESQAAFPIPLRCKSIETQPADHSQSDRVFCGLLIAMWRTYLVFWDYRRRAPGLREYRFPDFELPADWVTHSTIFPAADSFEFRSAHLAIMIFDFEF